MDPELAKLGFAPRPLAPDQLQALDARGYVILENAIDPPWLKKLRRAFDAIYKREGDKAGIEVNQVEGVRRLADLANKGEVFDQVYLLPQLLVGVAHVLQRPFKLHSLNGHDPLPDGGLQALHPDGGCIEGSYSVVNSMWMLDDFSRDNGATRVVPGSHKKSGKIDDYVADRVAEHPDQCHLEAPAGSVAGCNGSVWHSSYRNHSGRRRRTLHCAFIAREYAQQTNQRQYLRPETAVRLSPLARYILDVA